MIWEVLLDALIDTLKLLPLLFLVHVLIEVLEHSAISRIRFSGAAADDGRKQKKAANGVLKGGLAPLIGAGAGLLPQCGVSVAAAKLYSSKHIALGTLLAVFVATSDEAIPILLSSPASIPKLLPLIIVKFVAALLLGYGVTLVTLRRERRRIVDFAEDEEIEVRGCHHHEIASGSEHAHAHREHESEGENEQGENGESQAAPESEEELKAAKKARRHELVHRYLVHPILHTLNIALYILIINIVLGIIIFYVTEQRLGEFMNSVRLLQPLLCSIIGLIPNCASSVAITGLYASGTLSLGGTVAGLCVNAGLGLAVLFKENKNKKECFLIIAVLFVFAVLIGMATELILMAAVG